MEESREGVWGREKMDELESIAFSKEQRCSLGHAWDFHNLGVFNADMSQSMERGPEFDEHSFVEDECDHLSTGYLQDVLFEFSSKRRRLCDTSIQNCWTSNLIQNFSTTLTQITKCDDAVSELKTGEEANSDSSSISISSQAKESEWTPEKENLYCIDPFFSSGGSEKKRKKRVVLVYPFGLVKPGGLEGDATLNDINQRIQMRPTRAVRHPVGDFACRPLVSPHGPGLSGKAVVAFTRIHTLGRRGSITIIRTRG